MLDFSAGNLFFKILSFIDFNFHIDYNCYIDFPNCALVVAPKEYLSRILAGVSAPGIPLQKLKMSDLRRLRTLKNMILEFGAELSIT